MLLALLVAAALPAYVRAVLGDLVEPVHHAETHWRAHIVDPASKEDVYLVKLKKDVPKELAGARIFRVPAAIGPYALVVVGRAGIHLLVSRPAGGSVKPGEFGVVSPGFCHRERAEGIVLGHHGGMDGLCWNPAGERYDRVFEHEPEPWAR